MSPYLKKTEAEGTYATKNELNALDEDVDSQLAALSDALDTKLDKGDVVNNLTTKDGTKALSAEQGKKLQDEKLSKTEAEGAYATKSELTSHTGNKSNPHGVTKAQVGLSDVTNDAQVKRSEVVDDYIDVKEVAAGNTVASTNVTKRIITVQEACVPVLLDQIVGGTQTVRQASSTKAGGSLVYLKDMKQLCYRIDGTYCNNWSIADDSNKAKQYAELAGSDGLARKPIEGKVYVMPSAGSFKGVYVCKDGDLVLLSDKTEVINSLTSDRTDAALSAAQGKELKSQVDEKLSKTEASGTYLTKESAEGTYAKKTDLGIVIE